MQKIIELALKNDMQCSITQIQSSTNLTDDHLNHILSKYNDIFTLSDKIITYLPPYNIYDKTSLLKAIEVLPFSGLFY